MEQEEFFHLQFLPDRLNYNNGGQHADCIQDQDLAEDTEQLLRNDPGTAHRMGEKVLGGAVLLLIGEGGDSDIRCKESAADAQDISALQSVEPHEFTEI